MPTEQILKLQPNRTMHLRGFDDRGAAAAMHSATSGAFTVEGVFRDAADFCVLMVWDADDYFGHPRFKYLPDFSFSGIVLTFDVKYTNLRPLDSPLYPSIDWPYLDIVRPDGQTAQIRLSDHFITGAAAGWQRVQLSGLGDIRQAWLTFAPDPAAGVEYTGAEWRAEFDNWTVSDPNSKRALKVAGTGSVRIDSRDAWVTYTGSSWVEEASGQAGGTGWFNHGFARRAHTTGDKVRIQYTCQSTHDLYLGTSLYVDRGIVSVKLDGVEKDDLDCFLNVSAPVVTRRRIAASVTAGPHVVEITVSGEKHEAAGAWDIDSSGYYFYFDFLEAAVSGDAPAALDAETGVSAAVDYGTDHGYKLPPERLLWMQDQLGLAGELNVYVSVFWWNQREPSGRTVPSATVTFPDLPAGRQAFVDISGLIKGHFYETGDTGATAAADIRDKINAEAVGVWASASGAALTITNRSATYSFTLSAWYEIPPDPTKYTITHTGSLSGGVVGKWAIDPAATPVLNVAAQQWLAGLFAGLASRERGATVAFSLELLNPPSDWAARFNDGTAVETATGFGSNYTTHCACGHPDVIAYQKTAYLEVADLMDAAGLPVRLQCGEFLWWYFSGGSPVSMAYYDDETKAAAATALGRALHVFTGPNNDPADHVDDADFLAERLEAHIGAIRDHVRATYPAAVIELLLPLDVNYPAPVGRYSIGGKLNHHVNIPESFKDPATAPFEVLKIEGLDFGVSTRSYDLALRAMRWPFSETGWSWPVADVRYLMPLSNGGCPWEREYLGARGQGLPLVAFWAFDHICLLNWPMPPPKPRRSARLL